MMTMIMVIRRSGEEHAEHVLDGPPAHRAGVRRVAIVRVVVDRTASCCVSDVCLRDAHDNQ